MAGEAENTPENQPESASREAVMAEAVDMSSKYKQVKKVQLFLQLKALKTFGENLHTEEDGKLFLERAKRVPGIASTIKQLIDEINMATPEEEHEPEALEILEQLTTKIHFQASAVREELGARSYPGSRKSKFKHLPHLSLPTFSGELEDWPAFKKSYEKLIHNNEDLSAQDKIKYLIGCVRGEALSLTQGIPPLGANYPYLWQILEKKFNNQRLMADSHMKDLFSVESHPEHTLTTLNAFLENFHVRVKDLRGQSIADLADYFLFYLAYDRLPKATKVLFDEKHERTTFLSYDDLVGFVESEKAKFLRVTKKTKKKQQTLVSNKDLILTHTTFCILCPGGKHPLNTCPNFRQMSSGRRWVVVKQHKRCPNCLKYHGRKACMSRASCVTCKRKHHYLLHQEKQGESPQRESEKQTEEKESRESRDTDPVPSTSGSSSNATASQKKDETPETTKATEEVPEKKTDPGPDANKASTESKPRPAVAKNLFDPMYLSNCTFSPEKSSFFLNMGNFGTQRKEGTEEKEPDTEEKPAEFFLPDLPIGIDKA